MNSFDHAISLEKAVIALLPPDRRPTEAEVRALTQSLRQVFKLDDTEFELVLRRLHAKISITMELGAALKEETTFAPWLSARKASIIPFYWDRYRTFLLSRKSWPPLVVSSLDRVTDDILDLLGDPQFGGTWRRRGLVVGDVQSGKTATYTALCCKAADAGFRLIVLLTGTLENLRRQTQERLDEGFVGLDSSQTLMPGVRAPRLLGVGEIDRSRTAGVFTSRSRDFSQQLLNQLNFRLASFSEPVLLVVKKNRRVLENLETWLRAYNAGADDHIDAPLLMIDDEADSASINTSAIGDSPTAINTQIRKLVALFHRSSYVGFTATPFANVFIDPDSTAEMLEDDLFPRDFIYALDPPTNYMGPSAFFGLVDAPNLRYIEDAEAYFPDRHKSTLSVGALPQSLEDAIMYFILANTVRDLAGQNASHRSMLVNVSRFTNVQNQVASLSDGFVRDVQREIRLYSQLAPREALTSSGYLRRLKSLFESEFSADSLGWATVQAALPAAALPIVVRAVNQVSGSGALDYSGHRESGLRVIAVGGNSLSRGLTLEGLMVSYFFRNSQMYDTLLQMGRWFGYRDGYANLCRLWLTEEAATWYRHIWEATEELKSEFKRMQRYGATPREFGLKVRAHPESLIVTARNKMRTAETIERHISLSGEGLEAARLRAGKAPLVANAAAATRLVESIVSRGCVLGVAPRATQLWSDVPKDIIAAFLSDFQSDPLNFNFQVDVIARFLRETHEHSLQLWDVAIPRGNRPAEMLGGLEINPVERRLIIRNGSILVSGTKLRVGSGGAERLGLRPEQIQAVQSDPRVIEEYTDKGKQIPDAEYRRRRTKPLLLIYPIRGYIKQDDEPLPYLPDESPLFSLGLSFPNFDDSGVAAERVVYRVNLVQWRSMLQSEIGDDFSVDLDDLG